MQAYEFINNLIPPLKLSDKMGMALSWMEEIRTDVLPLTDQGKFLGLVKEDNIFEINDPETLVGDLLPDNPACWVFSDKHIYDVLRVSAEQNSNIVAVLDRDSNYLGVVTMEDAIAAFADSLSIQSQGSVLILSLNMTEYSLSEISRLIESENTKVLSSFITTDPLDETKIKLTLKLDQPELRHVKATLERFGYRVLDHYQEESGVTSEEDRIGNLLRFLDI
ncbi:cbs domain containing protein [Algoriphagus halophytocola]|uniref:Cbs domain containing protein n=1 Tax=Algoriphagus halophytocola TaxID=2991499 RepID=A0ABY6MDS7_9BACT|nr:MULTISPECIES: CBS domain-containing protein [unclassified Algoriphagus]UZD21900.1 cbs domain containing protein [Algoriphagus sp. TR-M5]WBL43150.1 cbs domain containing protein [Algoriphagus sp. TR-M9]